MADKAIYQHHERTTTVALEADLQLREIGIDPVLKMLTAYSEVLGTKIHAVTQESPTIDFAGAITIASTLGLTGNFAINTNKFTVAASSGNTTIAGSLTVASSISATGSISTSTTLTATLNAYVGDLRITSFTTQYTIPFATNTSGDMGASSSLKFNSATSTFQTANGSFSGTLGVTGVTTLSNDLVFNGTATGGTYRMYKSSVDGIAIRGGAGSTGDLSLLSAAGTVLLRNPTGTNDLAFTNPVTMASTLGVTGAATFSSTLGVTGLATLSAGASITGGTDVAGKLYYRSDFGITLRGNTASSYDLSLLATNGAYLLRNPTGTSNLEFPTGTIGITNLAGTGTRLVTATAAGVLGNATLINGAYEFVSVQAFDAGINFSDTTGTSATAAIWRDATNGVGIRGVNGSSYSLALFSASGSAIMTNTTSSTAIVFPGSEVSLTGGNLVISRSNSGASVLCQVENTNNANNTSHGVIQVASGGSSGGDARLQFTVTSVLDWSMGIDNSDSDNFKISKSTNLGTSDVMAFTGSTAYLYSDLRISYSNSGNSAYALIENTSNTVSSYAAVSITVGGTSAADPYVYFGIPSGTAWTIGADNSDSDSFKVSKGSVLGTDDYLTINSTGGVTVTTLTAGGFSAQADYIQVPWKSSAPTGANGNIYYNTSDGHIWAYVAAHGGWTVLC